jgi:fructose-1,6-bisphosphatase II
MLTTAPIAERSASGAPAMAALEPMALAATRAAALACRRWVALLPGGDADLLMGIGGTPEGLMTACAARALGGRMQARRAPQREDEAAVLARSGLDTERIYERDDLVAGESLFAATGVTGGALLRGPWHRDGQLWTESIVIAAGSVRRIVQAHPDEGLSP